MLNELFQMGQSIFSNSTNQSATNPIGL